VLGIIGVEQFGNTPLIEACNKASVETVRALLEARADTELRDKVSLSLTAGLEIP
jgi:hypothetical protein